MFNNAYHMTSQQVGHHNLSWVSQLLFQLQQSFPCIFQFGNSFLRCVRHNMNATIYPSVCLCVLLLLLSFSPCCLMIYTPSSRSLPPILPSPSAPRTVCVRNMEVWRGRGGADHPQICGSSASLNTDKQGRGSEVIRIATCYWSAGRS